MEHQDDRVLRRPEVKKVTGLTDSAIDREVRAGYFPKPFRLSSDPHARAVGWSANAIQSWLTERKQKVAA